HDYFALFAPLAADEIPENDPVLAMTVFEEGKPLRRHSHIRYLPPEDDRNLVKLHFSSNDLASGPPRHALGVNDLGGYMQAPARWGELVSKYDALLAANLNCDYPVDRRVLLIRCRVWLVLNGFSQEVNFDVQNCFRCGIRNLARWEFDVPVGQGKAVKLDITGRFALNANAVMLEFRRRPAGRNHRLLEDNIPTELIVRCDIDNRSNHNVTQAYTGAEHIFPEGIKTTDNGFIFQSSRDELFTVKMPECRFCRQDEWLYMRELPLESYYGLENKCDIFSPGYFTGKLSGGTQFNLYGTAAIPAVEPEFPELDRFPASCDMVEIAASSLKTFVVKRNEYRTVIAGYPWFLDWGRDTLIVLRGMIAANMLEDARDVILQFAGFEKSGTIPNMIRGNNDSNRETSDAPLWLAVAVDDYIKATGSAEILSETAGAKPRTVLEIIESIAHYYKCGTANGIFADRESNLIYSPPHFTWMDTNYPAGSPRAGYPVEIQALWYALQNMLARFDRSYKAAAEQTANSIKQYYYLPEYDRLSDCLHANPDTTAAGAIPDNALRPNTLLTVTLGAVQDTALQKSIVASCSKLIIPGAIRSLGNLQVIPPQPVKWHGQLLNDPDFPYMGHYCGPEDTSRKVS
ncbi:MAG: glycogen debranching enzyme N-terminal domain-containing protein, partial [Lentisphaeria bacterium]|nr:glycogen debranching enzyme N-terminal domain-containing protein [Lentisphaeria bacterium]